MPQGNGRFVTRRVLALALPLALLTLAAVSLPAGSQASPLEIVANGDAALAELASSLGWQGTGTATDPYRIEDVELSGRSGGGISLAGTRAHVLIRNVTVAVVSGGAGVALHDVRNVTLDSVTLDANGIGVSVASSADVMIRNSTIKANGVGVKLDDSTAVQVRDSRLSVNARDVSLRASSENVFRSNNLSIATGQVAFWLEDEASLANDVDASNVVNANPVWWVSGVRATKAAPTVIEAPRVELKGVTNVGQIIVHEASHVRIVGGVVRDGLAAGVFVSASDNVTFTGLVAEANTIGVEAHSSPDLVVEAATLGGNRVGVDASESPRLAIRNSTARGNAQAGILVQDAADVTLYAPRLDGNGVGAALSRVTNASISLVVARENGGDALRLDDVVNVSVASSLLQGNGGFGVSATRGANVAVVDAMLFDNDGGGVKLASTRGGFLLRNNVTGGLVAVRLVDSPGSLLRENALAPAANGFGVAFDDEASYLSSIDVSNTFRGTPVRWYVWQNGTIVEPFLVQGVRSELRGVTNVAQIGVVESENLTLADVVAANGTKHGVLVLRSHSVTVASSAARSNDADGVHVEDAHDFSMTTTLVRRNAEDGVSLLRSPRAILERNGAQLNGADGLSAALADDLGVERFTSEDNGGAGVRVTSSKSAGPRIDNGTLRRNDGGGVVVDASAPLTLRNGSFVRNVGVGLHVSNALAPGGNVSGNAFQNHTSAIRLTASERGVFRDNVIAARPGQVGFQFDDERSYAQNITSDNLYNGVAMRWIVDAHNVTLANVTLALPGITNVAQVLVHTSDNVTLDGVRAANGMGDGVLVISADNVTLRNVTATDNEKSGVRGERAGTVRVENGTFARNGASGAHLVGPGANVTLARIVATGNGAHGLAIENALVAATDVVTDDNARDGVSITGNSARVSEFERVSATSNRGRGISIDARGVGNITDAKVTNNTAAGLHVTSADGSGTVRRLHATNNSYGFATIGGVARVLDGAFVGNDVGITIAGGSRAFEVVGNTFASHKRGIELRATTRGHFERNVMEATPRSFAFYFEDTDSYDNVIGDTNTLNGRAVQWYVRLQNATVEAPRGEWPGLTNVAQLMVFRSSNVTVVDPVGRDGMTDGIVVFASENVTLVDPVASGNRGYGLAVVDSDGIVVERGAVERNRAGGALLLRSDATLESTTLARNDGFGVRARDGGGNVFNATVRDNDGDGIRLDLLRDARVASTLVEGNGGDGVWVERATEATRVTGNRILNSTVGMRLTAPNGATIEANDIRIPPEGTGIHLAGEAAYDAKIPPTNTVNGVPVRWYVGLAGTEDAPIDVSGFTVQGVNVTNVAQVMIHRSAYVRVHDVVTVGGVRGVFVHASSTVYVENVTTTRAQIGVHLAQSLSSRVLDVDARGSRVGVQLDGVGSSVVARVDASGARVGVSVSSTSAGNRVFSIHAPDAIERSVRDPGAERTPGNNLVIDAGRDVRTGARRSLSFTEALTSWRFEEERIVHQAWDWGDGLTAERASSVPYRPTHAYASPGDYVVTLRVRIATGETFTDTVTVRVLGPATPPPAPVAVQGNGEVRVSWRAPSSDGGMDIIRYALYRGDAEGELTLHANVTGSPHVDTLGVDGALRWYAVAAVTADGEGPRSLAARAQLGRAPDAPVGLAARASPGAVDLSWTPPLFDGGLAVTGYVVERGDENGTAFEPIATLGNVTRHRDAAVTNGETYTYRVRAINSLGESAPSTSAQASPVSLPPAPDNVRVLAGDRRATIAWDPVTADASAPVLHYRVYRGDALVAQIGDVVHVDVDLSNAQDYEYAVAAVTRAGEGPRSEVAGASPGPLDLLAPVALSFTPQNGTVTNEVRPTIVARFIDDSARVNATLRLDGREVASVAGDVSSITWRPPEGLTYGDHVVGLVLEDARGRFTHASARFRLLSPAEELPHVTWRNLTLPGTELALGGSMTIVANATNDGYLHVRMPVELKLGEQVAASAEIDLAPGESMNVTFLVKPDRAGTFPVLLGDAPPVDLIVIPLEDDPDALDDNETADNATAPEDGGFLGIPAPGVLPTLALAVAVALFSRAKARRHG